MALARALEVLMADLFRRNHHCRALWIIGQLLVVGTGPGAALTTTDYRFA